MLSKLERYEKALREIVETSENVENQYSTRMDDMKEIAEKALAESECTCLRLESRSAMCPTHGDKPATEECSCPEKGSCWNGEKLICLCCVHPDNQHPTPQPVLREKEEPEDLETQYRILDSDLSALGFSSVEDFKRKAAAARRNNS